MWEQAGTVTFAAVAVAVQAALGLRLIVSAPRDPRATTLGALFVVNATITGMWAVIVAVPTPEWIERGPAAIQFFFSIASTAGIFDMATNLMILLFVFMYPTRGEGPGTSVWPILLAACLVAPVLLQAITPFNIWLTRAFAEEAMDWAMWFVAFLPFELTFVALMLRWSRLWGKPANPAERMQFALIFAAFAMRGAHLLVLIPAHFVNYQREHDIVFAQGSLLGYDALYVVMPLALLASIGWMLWHRRRPEIPNRATDLVLLFMALGLLEGAINVVGLFGGHFAWWQSLSSRLDVLVVRPILVLLALGYAGHIAVGWRVDVAVAFAAAALGGAAAAAVVLDSAGAAWWPAAMSLAGAVGVAAYAGVRRVSPWLTRAASLRGSPDP